MSTILSSAKFWQFINGSWVRLTIRVGERLTWHHGWHNGEGHSFECLAWANDGDGIRRERIEGGRDCDGYVESQSVDYCALDRLDAVQVDHECADAQDMFKGSFIRRPDFQELEPDRCYDQYAQAANY